MTELQDTGSQIIVKRREDGAIVALETSTHIACIAYIPQAVEEWIEANFPGAIVQWNLTP